MRSGRSSEAISHYERVVQARPDDGEALNNLGAAFAAVGDYTRARTAFERVLQLQPDHVKAKRNLTRLRSVEGGSETTPIGEGTNRNQVPE